MSDTLESLRHKIESANELHSVVRTMKAMAAASIGQYEKAVRSLADYYRTLQLGLAVCLWQANTTALVRPGEPGATGVLVFGSDQGLVGQFNEALAAHVAQTLAPRAGDNVIWAVGERMQSRLVDAGLPPIATFAVPNSVTAITPLIGQILGALETARTRGEVSQVYVFHNRPKSGAAYEPITRRLLPLDEKWQRDLQTIRWPTINRPEVIGDAVSIMFTLIGEYLFVSLFQACAESLASENASRLAAMQRAEKNIDEISRDLGLLYHRQRQTAIDEELFDLVSGFEALKFQ